MTRLKVYNKEITSADMGVPTGKPTDPDYAANRFNIILSDIPINTFSGYQSRIGNQIKIYSVEVMLGVTCHPEWLRLVMYCPKQEPRTVTELKSVPYSHFHPVDDDVNWVLHDELRYLNVKNDTTNGGTNDGTHLNYSNNSEHRSYFFKHRFDKPITCTYKGTFDHVSINTYVQNQIRLAGFATGLGSGTLTVFGWSKIWFSDD